MAQVLVQNDAGCPEALANGTDGQVLTLVNGEPAYADTAETHDPVTLGAGNNPALALATQQLTLNLDAAGSYNNAILTAPDALTSTSVQDAIDELALCRVCDIVFPNTCVAGGLGGVAPNRYALRTATLAGGVLTLGGAPEHDTRSFHSERDNMVVAQGPFDTLTTPNNGVPDFYDLAFETIDIVNLSECRNVRVFFSVTSWWFGTGMTADTDLSVALLIRNGPLTTSPVVSLAVEKNSGGTNEDVLGTSMTCTFATLIPPLGTQQLTLQYQLQMFNGTLNRMNVVQRHYTWMYSTQDG
jgi:hypothetical protein